MVARVVLLLLSFMLLGARDGPWVQAVGNTRFPPSFEDNVFAYGFALFSLTIISAVSAAFLLQFVFDKRAQHQLSSEREMISFSLNCKPGSACQLYRFQIGTLMWTMLLGTLPDVLVLMAWGEASDETMTFLFQLDRVFDGLAAIPFFCFAMSYLLSGQLIAHKLALDAEDVPLRPRWVQVKAKMKIIFLAFVIALGVTTYKAGMV